MNYRPITTFSREKVPVPTADGRSTIMRPTGRTVQTPGTGSGLAAHYANQPRQAPATPSTGPTADSSADYDSTAIGFQHYHDALANASGGLDPNTGTYIDGHFKGMNPQQAMHTAQKGWLQLGTDGQANMVKKLAPLYGTRMASPGSTPPATATTAPAPPTGAGAPPAVAPASAPMLKPGQPTGIQSQYGTASNSAIPRPAQRPAPLTLKPRVADEGGAVDLTASKAAGTIKRQPKEPTGLAADIPRPIMGGSWMK